eukprot:1174174-Prorocentrum_minimum.AAC.1
METRKRARIELEDGEREVVLPDEDEESCSDEDDAEYDVLEDLQQQRSSLSDALSEGHSFLPLLVSQVFVSQTRRGVPSGHCTSNLSIHHRLLEHL